MKVMLDQDGVLADFDSGWLSAYNRAFGTDYKASECIGWDWIHRITPFDTETAAWRWARSVRIFDDLAPLPGAIEGVNTLRAQGHDIVIATSKPRWAAHVPELWMNRHGIPFDDIIITSDKASVDADVYLDDAQHNIERLVKLRSDRIICMFNTVHNHPVSGAYVINNWNDFLITVQLANGALVS